jgi:hypothetical protein
MKTIATPPKAEAGAIATATKKAKWQKTQKGTKKHEPFFALFCVYNQAFGFFSCRNYLSRRFQRGQGPIPFKGGLEWQRFWTGWPRHILMCDGKKRCAMDLFTGLARASQQGMCRTGS